MTRRRHGLAPALAAAAAVVCLALPSAAGAHAYLVRTDPADGSRFDTAPGRIRLSFSENVSAKLSRVKLTGAHTGEVAGATVDGGGATLLVSLPRLGRDTYSLYWLTTSADDLHITRGTVSFSVGPPLPGQVGRPTPSPVSGPAATGTDVGEVALRWLDFAAIAWLLGALALLAVCVPRAAGRGAAGLEHASRRLVPLAATAAVLALAAGVALLFVQAESLSAVGTVLDETSYGPAWIARQLLLVVLLVAAPLLGRRRARAPLTAVGVLAAAGLCFALAWNSHSAAARGHLSVASCALAVHLLAAAVWAGGVCALAFVLIGDWRRKNPVAAGLLLRSFGGLAALGVAVVAISGLYSAGVDVDSPGDLVSSFYGRTLLVKTGLFLLVGAIGLSNSLLVRSGRHGGRLLGRGVRLEAALAAGVILLAALLTASAPPQGRRLAATGTPAAAGALASTQAGDLLVSLSVKPNQPGVNFVTAGVFDTRRPAPAPIRAVDLAVGGRWQEATRVRDRSWQVTGDQLTRPGRWPIRVRVHRPGLPDETASVAWTLPRLRPAPPPRGTVLSDRPLAPILSNVAAGGALVLFAGLLILLVGRRRSVTTIPATPTTTVDGVR